MQALKWAIKQANSFNIQKETKKLRRNQNPKKQQKKTIEPQVNRMRIHGSALTRDVESNSGLIQEIPK